MVGLTQVSSFTEIRRVSCMQIAQVLQYLTWKISDVKRWYLFLILFPFVILNKASHCDGRSSIQLHQHFWTQLGRNASHISFQALQTPLLISWNFRALASICIQKMAFSNRINFWHCSGPLKQFFLNLCSARAAEWSRMQFSHVMVKWSMPASAMDLWVCWRLWHLPCAIGSANLLTCATLLGKTTFCFSGCSLLQQCLGNSSTGNGIKGVVLHFLHLRDDSTCSKDMLKPVRESTKWSFSGVIGSYWWYSSCSF